MARIRTSGVSGSSENSIIFIPSGGHSHDGVTSSLISTEKYSIYDFSPSFVNSTQSQTRAIRKENNRLAFESLVVNIVNQSVLVPAGIRLNPGTLNASAIIANTITATHIAANTITADELVSNIILVNNTISSNLYTPGSVGWRISNDGSAEFSNVVVRGNIFSNVGTIGGWTLSGTSLASGTGSTTLYSNGTAVIGNTTIAANGQITNINNSFSVSSAGVLTATGANFSGTITGATTATADLFIREPAGGRFYLTYLLGDYVQIKRTQSDYSTTTGSGAFLGYFNASAVSDDATMIVNSTTPYQSGNYVQAKSDGTLTATGEISKRDSTRVRARISNDSLLFWDASGAQKAEYAVTSFYADSGTVVGVFSAGTKYFRIQHPSDDEKMLVHSSLEGPTTDVFYRGESQLTDGIAEIELPNYFEHLTIEDNRTIIVTPIVSEDSIYCCAMACTRISDGRFKVIKTDDSNVYNQKFSWVVLATRKDSSFDVEPLKNARELGN
jgi:hypothetical protein